jgi:2-polyprenyl-3-methyl-5-hydroxy-6-metoxy-1,4-benzoquinol methylase
MQGMVKTVSGKEVPCFYYPNVFNDVFDLDYAKRLTVTREGSLTPEVRWDVETKFTIGTLLDSVPLDGSSNVLDYGCGVGRLSKALIDRTNCSVVGVDLSANMRALAMKYVADSHFSVCSSDMLRASGKQFDCAIAAWVLQHCLYPNMDIDLIVKMLKPKAYLLVLATRARKIPIQAPADSTLCWLDDGLDVEQLLLKDFDVVQQGTFDTPELMQLKNDNYWAVYQRK